MINRYRWLPGWTVTLLVACFLSACITGKKEPEVQQRTVVHEELEKPPGERTGEVKSIQRSLAQLVYAPEGLGFAYKETEVNRDAFDQWWNENHDTLKSAVSDLPEGYILQLTGHTDSIGPRQPTGNKPGNLALSRQRAESLKEALSDRGIPEDRMITEGVADDRLLPDLQPRDRRHRRVTFSVVQDPNIEDPALKRALEADFIDRLKEGSIGSDELADPGDPMERQTVAQVLNRNGQWKDMLVVVDVTGSMMPFLGQVVNWMNLNSDQKKVRKYVFFNDGDNKPESAKVLGNTGGIYIVQDWASMDEALDVARVAIRNGYGGTRPESDVEALIKGTQSCRECGDVVLVADNGAPVRDIELANQLDRPVRVILCDALDRINPEYLELARLTRGSVHTIEQDIANLHTMKEGDSFEYANNIYTIRNGSFIETNLEKERKELLAEIRSIEVQLQTLENQSQDLQQRKKEYEKQLAEVEKQIEARKKPASE